MPRKERSPSRRDAEPRVDSFERFFEAVPDAILVVDEEGRIVLVNDHARSLFGYEREELVGREIELLIPERFRSGHESQRRSFSEHPRARPIGSGLQLFGRRQDGSEFPADISLSPVGEEGRVLCVVRDITERTRIHGELKAAHDELEERVRERTAELESANRALHKEIAQRKRVELRLVAQHAVTRALAESTALPEARHRLLKAVCESMGWERGELWLPSEQTGLLRCVEKWQHHHVIWDEADLGDREGAFPPGMGLPGRVWLTREPEWIPDVALEPTLQCGLVRHEGPHAAFAYPLCEAGEVRAVVVFFSCRLLQPDTELLKMFGSIDDQFGQFLERLSAQTSLRESEERYRRLADNAPDMIYRLKLKPEKAFEYVNPAATQITGYAPSEYYHDPDLIARRTHPEDLPLLDSIIQSPPSNWAQVNIRWLRKDGVTIWTEHRIVPVFDSSGEFVALKGIVRDVTERKLAQDALQQQLTYASLINRITRTMASNQNLPHVLQVVPEYLESHLATDTASLYLFDAEGLMAPVGRGPRGQILARKIKLGDAPIDMEDVGLHRCLRGETMYMPDLASAGSAVLQRMASAGIHSLVAVPLVAENEVIGILTVSRRAVDGFSSAEQDFLHTLADHVALAVYQARLLTDLKAAYEELKTTHEQVIQTERLRALGQLASGIAHDINNSLSAVMLFATIGLRRPGLEEALRHCFENIEKAATDASSTVSRLREFYRPREPMEAFETVDINEIVQDVLLLTRAKWKDEPQARGVRIEMSTEGEARQFLQGHRSELREVLTNLVINAVDAMPRGGTITIRTRDEVEHVTVEVADTGIGMDESTRRRIFEPFFTTKGPQGTGLGMSVCWGVIQRHNGRISVWSEFGRGTVVTIQLPLGTAGGSGASSISEEAHVAPLRILCVDDEPLIREGLQTLLTQMGHSVTVASDGVEALEFFGAQRHEVVITDLGMPLLSGHEVARAVKEQAPQTPVILLTGWGEWQDATRPAHVDLVSRKPPTHQSLLEALQTVARPVEG